MSVCASGCVIRSEHSAECSGAGEDGLPCRGCAPRSASMGVLCSWCWGRLQSVVRTLPALVEHLFDMGGQVGSSPSAGTEVRRPAGPGCLWPEALSAADELHSMLAAWCDEVAEECPAVASVPPAAGSRRTRARVLIDEGTGLPFVSGSVVCGVRSPSATRALVSWLDPHLGWVSSRSWSAVMLEELGAEAARASARWPMEEPERRVTDVRCPSCGALSLVVRPVRVVGGQSQVVCSRVSCGVVLTEDDWARALSWAVAVATGEGVA